MRADEGPIEVALTFDAEHPDRPGWGPDAPDRILGLLHEAGVLSTFFLQGRWAQAHPEVARKIADGGHVVGSHSHFHARMTLFDGAGLRRDIAESEAAIREAAASDPRPWFRCPWGDGGREDRVTEALTAAGYRHAGWDVLADDWEPSRSSRDVADTVIDGVRDMGGRAVVLLHTWPATVPAALEAILESLESVARFVTVEEIPDEHLAATKDPPSLGEQD